MACSLKLSPKAFVDTRAFVIKVSVAFVGANFAVHLQLLPRQRLGDLRGGLARKAFSYLR